MKRHLEPLVWLALAAFAVGALLLGHEGRPVSTAQFGPVCPAPTPE